jgi:hypothetical protein
MKKLLVLALSFGLAAICLTANAFPNLPNDPQPSGSFQSSYAPAGWYYDSYGNAIGSVSRKGVITPFVIQGQTQYSNTVDSQGYNAEFNYASNTGSAGPGIVFKDARGAAAVPLATTSGDIVGTIDFFGYTGASYVEGAGIDVTARATWTTSSAPTQINFLTTGLNSTTPSATVTISNATVTLTPPLALATGTTAAAPLAFTVGAFASTPIAGRMEYFNGNLTFVNTGTLRQTIRTNPVIEAAPTISSGFGTSPAILAGTNTSAFTVNVGTGGTASAGVIGLPTAPNGWICEAEDQTTHSTAVSRTAQTANSTTSVTLTQYNDVMSATAWVASDTLLVRCSAF